MKTLGLHGWRGKRQEPGLRGIGRFGASIVVADREGHEALRLPQIEAAARHRWGDAIFGQDGHIDRPKLARVVFAPAPDGPRERKYLEKLSHPEIGRRLAAQIEVAKAVAPLAVVDAALLFEAGWNKLCDCTAFVDAPRRFAWQGPCNGDGRKRILPPARRRRIPLDSKRARADWIIDNSGPVEHTQAQVSAFGSPLSIDAVG